MENIVPEKASRANLSETGAVQIELKRKMQLQNKIMNGKI